MCQYTAFDKLLFLDHTVYPFNWFLPLVSLFNTILVDGKDQVLLYTQLIQQNQQNN